MTPRYRFRSLVVLTFALSLALAATVFGQRVTSMTDAADPQIDESIRRFVQVYSAIEQNYAEPVSGDKAIYNGAIPGMLRGLDPHSNFFDPKSYAAMREEQRGRYYGVGMQIGVWENHPMVMRTFESTPAFRAGVHPGDVILSVADEVADKMSTEDVAKRLKGPKGTPVKLKVQREGVSDPMEFTLVRDEIPRSSVDIHFLLEPGVGYLHIAAFGETTGRDFDRTLAEFGDLKGLVLDLRGNPGGLVDAGVGVADRFLPKGAVIVSHRGRNSAERVYRAENGNGGKIFPLVVLVDGGTASAAEIVSGAIQDHDRGLIVGQTTFGKGLVQTVYQLSEDTGLALTAARYYTPSGRLIQRQYSGKSLFEYYREAGATKDDENTSREVRNTDSGRTVYGGGGITPDIKLAPFKAARYQNVLGQNLAFLLFARHYLVDHKPTPGFHANDEVVQQFEKFLGEKKVSVTGQDLGRDKNWLTCSIEAEVANNQFGEAEGRRVRAACDPDVAKALALLPKAGELAEHSRSIVAQKAEQHKAQ